MRHILKCSKCGQYTMKDSCPKCGVKNVNPKPAKYSPEDRMGKYRREAKRSELKERRLI